MNIMTLYDDLSFARGYEIWLNEKKEKIMNNINVLRATDNSGRSGYVEFDNKTNKFKVVCLINNVLIKNLELNENVNDEATANNVLLDFLNGKTLQLLNE